MPRIPNTWLDAVVYLYPSVEVATESKQVGGTGFIVGIPPGPEFPLPNFQHLFVVTNEHVARRGCPVVRVNRRDGGFDVLPMEHGDWFPHPDGEDLAFAALRFDSSNFRMTTVDLRHLLTREQLATNMIGPGDEAFLIGRYVHLDGTDENRATVRFGNVAAMPQPITQPQRENHPQESFLVEMRSLSGYSGSPVFAHHGLIISTGTHAPNEGELVVASILESRLAMIGLDWGHHPFTEPLRSPTNGRPVPEGTYIQGNSGMAMVVPAWQITDFLMADHFVEARRVAEESWMAENDKDKAPEPVMDSAGDEVTVHDRDDFMADLSKVREPEREPTE